MVTFLEKIKRSVQKWCKERTARIESKRQTALDVEAWETVQVMEFNGRLYVSVNDIPMFDIDDVRGSLSDAVARARQNYKDWKKIYPRLSVYGYRF